MWFFTNSLTSRFFLGNGGTTAFEQPVSDQAAGFWRVREAGPLAGVCVADSGEYAGKLVR